MRSCATCEHCNTDEAVLVRLQNRPVQFYEGFCTKEYNALAGLLVPAWAGVGCPDYTRKEREVV